MFFSVSLFVCFLDKFSDFLPLISKNHFHYKTSEKMCLQTSSPFPNLQNQPFVCKSVCCIDFILKGIEMKIRFSYDLVVALRFVILIYYLLNMCC